MPDYEDIYLIANGKVSKLPNNAHYLKTLIQSNQCFWIGAFQCAVIFLKANSTFSSVGGSTEWS